MTLFTSPLQNTMPISEYLAKIRALVGHRLLCLPSVTGIVKNAQGSILLVRSTGAQEWTTPGGMIEPNERPSESIVRELKEELDIDVKPKALLGVYSGPEYLVRYPNDDEVVYVTSVFECELLAGEPEPDKDEITACRFFSKAEREKLLMPDWLDDLLENIETGNQFN